MHQQNTLIRSISHLQIGEKNYVTIEKISIRIKEIFKAESRCYLGSAILMLVTCES